MKSNITKIVVAVAAAATMAGCVQSGVKTTRVAPEQSYQGVASNSGSSEETIKTVSCPAPVLSVSLAELSCKASACKERTGEANDRIGALMAMAREAEGVPDLAGFGSGLTEMLASAMQQSGCFDVLDRQLMEELAQERKLRGQDMTGLASADQLITGSITSLSYDKKKSSFGGGLLPVVGGFKSSSVTAKIGMDVRVVDVNTGRVSYARTLNATSGSKSFGAAGGGLLGSALVGGTHSVKGGLEMEEASRILILDAVVDMVEKMVPQGKYKVEHIKPEA